MATKNAYGLQYVVNDKGKYVMGRRKNRGKGPVVTGHFCHRVEHRPLTAADRLWCEGGPSGRARRRSLQERDPIAYKRARQSSRDNPWFRHLREYIKQHPTLTWSKALVQARATYTRRRPSKKQGDGGRAPNRWVLYVKALQARTPGLVYSKALHIAKKTYVKQKQTKKNTMVVSRSSTSTPIAMYTDPLSADGPTYPIEVVEAARRMRGTIIRLGTIHRIANGPPTQPGRVVTGTPTSTDAEVRAYRTLARLKLGPRVLYVDRTHGCIVVEGLDLTLYDIMRKQGGRLSTMTQNRIAAICNHPQIQLAASNGFFPLHCFVTSVSRKDRILLIHPSTGVYGGNANPMMGANRAAALRVVSALKSTTTTRGLALAAGILGKL